MKRLNKIHGICRKSTSVGLDAAANEFPTVFRARAAENGETFPEATHAP